MRHLGLGLVLAATLTVALSGCSGDTATPPGDSSAIGPAPTPSASVGAAPTDGSAVTTGPLTLLDPDTGKALPAPGAGGTGGGTSCLSTRTYRVGIAVALADYTTSGSVTITAARLSEGADAIVPSSAAYAVPSTIDVGGMPGLIPVDRARGLTAAHLLPRAEVPDAEEGHLVVVLRTPAMARFDTLTVEYRTADGVSDSVAVAVPPRQIITADDCDQVRGVDPQN